MGESFYIRSTAQDCCTDEGAPSGRDFENSNGVHHSRGWTSYDQLLWRYVIHITEMQTCYIVLGVRGFVTLLVIVAHPRYNNLHTPLNNEKTKELFTPISADISIYVSVAYIGYTYFLGACFIVSLFMVPSLLGDNLAAVPDEKCCKAFKCSSLIRQYVPIDITNKKWIDLDQGYPWSRLWKSSPCAGVSNERDIATKTPMVLV